MSRIAYVSDQPLWTSSIDTSGLRRVALNCMTALKKGARTTVRFVSMWYL